MKIYTVGDYISLQYDDLEIIECEECNHIMVNIDEADLQPGDLRILKRKGIRVSNPDTDEEICEHCEDPGSAMSTWYDDEEEDNDSYFYKNHHSNNGGGGGFSFKGFGGFGGGSFDGGGASRGF